MPFSILSNTQILCVLPIHGGVVSNRIRRYGAELSILVLAEESRCP